MSKAPARSAPPNAAKPMLAQRSPGTLTPTATAAETLLDPSVFITTTDHLPGRSFQSSVPVHVEVASQKGCSPGRPGCADPACVTYVTLKGSKSRSVASACATFARYVSTVAFRAMPTKTPLSP